MKTYTNLELKEIIELHQTWLRGGQGGVRADLTGADLTNANLAYATLTNAKLTGADLTNTNLTNANLTGAKLTGASLWDTVGNNNEIKSLQEFDEYKIAYTKDRLQIGCKNYSFQEWWEFTDEEILAMDGKKALSFWKNYKETINNTIESNPAV